MNALVGYTGFVGSNLYKKGQFDHIYNSKKNYVYKCNKALIFKICRH